MPAARRSPTAAGGRCPCSQMATPLGPALGRLGASGARPCEGVNGPGATSSWVPPTPWLSIWLRSGPAVTITAAPAISAATSRRWERALGTLPSSAAGAGSQRVPCTLAIEHMFAYHLFPLMLVG